MSLTIFPDEEALLSVPTAPDIGLIELIIYNVKVLEKGQLVGSRVPEAKTFHEKTKKGISHQTRYLQA